MGLNIIFVRAYYYIHYINIRNLLHFLDFLTVIPFCPNKKKKGMHFSPTLVTM